ncbi:hypothetical protein JCM8202v2_004314 [Rhodotorula sphaerocarpa]
MVDALEQNDALAASDDDKPPDSGSRPHPPPASPAEHADPSSNPLGQASHAASPRGHALAPANAQLKPTESLTSRLLHSIAPSAAAEQQQHRYGTGPDRLPSAPNPQRSRINRSSSLPNLDRRRAGYANGVHQLAVHGPGDEADRLSIGSFASIEKAHRVHTFAGSLPDNVSAGLAHGADPAPGFGDATRAEPFEASATGAATPTARPPLLSKKLLEPKKRLGKNPSVRQCMINVARYSWLNLLFVFVPVSWAMHFSHQSATVTFCVSFFAIVPLAAILGFATEELAIRVGDAFGGLLNATFGNAVELIIAILALVKGELGIVRSSMLGSILSNCLLVLGGCFFAGGIRFHEQGYSLRAAQLNINLLGIAVVAIVIPVAFHSFTQSAGTGAEETTVNVLKLSRGISFILLFVYDLTFQLWTHAYLYAAPKTPRPPTSSTAALLIYNEGPPAPSEGKVFRIPSLPSWGSSSSSSSSSSSTASAASRGRARRDAAMEEDEPVGYSAEEAAQHDADLARVPTAASDTFRRPIGSREKDLEAQHQHQPTGVSFAAAAAADAEDGTTPFRGDGGGDEHAPQLSVWFAFALLAVITGLTGLTAECLVDSIDGLTETGNVSKEFVALILLPVVGNAAEHVTAITVATKNKLNLSLAVAVGSSIQIAFFVIPVLVLLGWAIGQPLDFDFNQFETLVVFLAGCVVNWAIQDGRTNWLEGLTLMALYVIIALVFWWYDPPVF